MRGYMPSGLVRGVTIVITAFYWIFAVLTGLFVGGVAFLELSGSEGVRSAITIPVAVSAESGAADLPMAWGTAAGTVALEYGQAVLRVPLSLAPLSFRAVSYSGALVGILVFLAFLHLLRALFRSLRDGAPFDSRNTSRLRGMGVLLIAGHVLVTLLGVWQAATVLPAIDSSSASLSLPSPVDERLLFAFDEGILLLGCMLFALGEAFRHGAALEDEQSLVV